MGSPIGEK